MDTFTALIHSLGEHVVDYIGKDHLERLDVFGDEGDSSAHIEIFLSNQTWDEHSRAIDKMIELRAMFLDELSIDYRFVESDSETNQSAEARHSTYSMA